MYKCDGCGATLPQHCTCPPPPRRVRLIVELNLDPIPGAFNTPASAVSHVDAILTTTIPHYRPSVEVA